MRTPITEASISQQMVLAIVPKVSSMLSILCGLYIIWDTISLPRNTRKMYHRIILGMSLSDVVSSSAWFFTTWPTPPEVLPVWGASGTQATCSAQGFFAQLSLATVLYNGSLALYYYLVIRRGWTERALEQSKVEWFMHGISLSIPLATSSAAVGLGLMNPLGWDCWIAGVPLNCKESWVNNGKSTCTRGDNSNLYQWVFFYLPLWMTILTVTYIMGMILHQFREADKSIDKWRQKAEGTGTAHTSQNRNGARNSARNRRSKEIGKQCLFYVGAFYVTWLFPTILRIHELTSDTVWYHWVQISAAFVPLQGVLNFIVYLRPRFAKVHEKCKLRRQEMKARTEETVEESTSQQQDELQVVVGSAAEIEKNPTSTPTTEDATEDEGRAEDDNLFGAASKSTNIVREILSEMKEVLLEGDKGAGGEYEVEFTESRSQIQDSMEAGDEDLATEY